MGQKILVVEDEGKIREIVKLYLQQDGFAVLEAKDGAEALELFRREAPDLVILDLMLPKIPGEEVSAQIRAVSEVPIIMLTAKTSEEDRVRGLESGVDDYVTKPFSPKELVARVNAVLRRHRRRSEGDLKSGDKVVCIDRAKHEVTVNGNLISLTPTEYRLLVLFLNNPGVVFSRAELAERAFGWDYEGYEETIYVHIKNLRKKLEPHAPQDYIDTVYGVGYRWLE
ncbi:MAG TPA: response regulator transcription factor [Firmicutes bacterium]|nr:response regulator transcription factor [Bacillota bacterium]